MKFALCFQMDLVRGFVLLLEVVGSDDGPQGEVLKMDLRLCVLHWDGGSRCENFVL